MNDLKTAFLATALVWISTLATSPCFAAEPKADPASRLLRDASLMLLKEGNARYSSGKAQHPHLDAERRSSTVAQGQEPFATILACSDSREPVELIFDRGIGDLFVVRVAGNIAGGSELASVEYGVGHLNTPLLIVMGHSRCGAVTAVVQGAELHGHLHLLGEKIKPAVEKVKAETADLDEAVPKAIQANVWQVIEDILKQSAAVRERVATGRVHVMGAIYDLEQGKVSWLGAHPAESAIIALAEQAQTDSALARKLSATSPSAAKAATEVAQGPASASTQQRKPEKPGKTAQPDAHH